MNDNFKGSFVKILILVLLVFAGIYLLPWRSLNWGRLELAPSSTISVTGYSESKEKNQIATFTAGVSRTSDNKDEAVAYVNQKVGEIITAVKEFGVASEDLKTQNINIYQKEETYYEDGRQKSRPGQWSVGNSVEITLRDVEKASALTSLLSSTGATNVYGPNFTLDNTKKAETDLLKEAIDDARAKAEIVASAAGRKLGEIISVNEGGVATSPMALKLEGLGGGGGGASQPGTGTVSKTVSVTFELD
jgi:uncharacterized protein YggE